MCQKKNLFYIYLIMRGGGSCVVSADKRFGNIIVQLDKVITITENMEAPVAFVDYLENASKSIKKIKEGKMGTRLDMNLNKLNGLKPVTKMDYSSECEGEFYVPFGTQPWSCFPGWEIYMHNEGHIVQTQWGQGTGYNDLVPFSCGTGKAPAGCVATAMAQALSVIQRPVSYN